MRNCSFQKSRLLAAFLAVFLMLSFLPSLAVPAQAAEDPVLDQVNETCTIQESMYLNYIAQIFTAGKTGVLSNLDLYLHTRDSLDAGFRVWIEEVRDDPQDLYYGMPESTKMIGYSHSESIENERWIKGAPDSWAWYSFTFDQMARVQAGKQYAICLKAITDNVRLGGDEKDTDYYAGGAVWRKSSVDYPWDKLEKIDLAFKTYVSSPSNDATLYNVTLENGELYNGQLHNEFNPENTEYTVLMDMNQTTLNITPSLIMPTAATITVDGIACRNGSTQTVAVPTDKDIPIVVTAEDGITTKTYTLKAAHSYKVGFAPLSGGSIKADPLVKKQETTINLTITPDLFKRLKPGSLKYSDGTGNHLISGTSFTMPDSDVTVSAEFLDAPQTATRKIPSVHPGGVSCLYINSEDNCILTTSANNEKLYSVNPDKCEVAAEFTVDSTFARDAIGIVDSPDTNKMYILNNGSSNISVYDRANFNKVDHSISVGANPCDLTWNSSLNRLYAVNRDVDSVSMINGADDTVFNVDVGSHPCDMALDTTINKIYVANSGSDNMTVLDGISGAVLATVNVGSAPCAVAVDSASQRAYVVNSGSNDVTVIDTADNSVTATVNVGASPSAIETNPDTHKIYVANSTGNTLTIIDGSTFDTTTVPVGSQPIAIAVNPNNNVVYVLNYVSQSVTAVDENDRTINYALGIAPVAIAVNTKTNRVYVAHSASVSWDIITEIPALIPETLAVSNPTTAGITVSLNPLVETLTATDFTILDSSGAAVTVSDAATEDIGSTYQISAVLAEGQTYSLTALHDGYSFGVAKSFTVPGTPVDTHHISVGTFDGGSITALPTTAAAGATVNLTIAPEPGKQLKAGTLKFSYGTTDSAILDTSFTMPAADVTVSAVFEDVPPSPINKDKVAADKAALTIGYAAGDNDTSVTKDLNLTETGAVYGSTITWVSDNTSVVSNSGIVTRPVYTSGDASVTVTATVYNSGASDTKTFGLVVLKLPQTTCTITFNKNGGDIEASPSTKTSVLDGSLDTLPTSPTRSGYVFSGWNTKADGTGTAFTAATTVNADLTVYAQWTVISSNGSGGGISSPTTTTTTPTTTTTNTGTASSSVTSTTTAEAKSDSNGKATAAVTETQVKDAVNKAVEEAAKQGEGTSANVEIKVAAPAEAKTVEASLSKAAFAAVADSKTDALTAATPVASITFDKAAITAISREATADVKITASKVNTSDLSEAAKTAVGDRPVFNFSVTSGNKTISQFGGTVTLSIPYAPAAGEDVNAIAVYYINSNGELETVMNGHYDASTSTVVFTTNHFSTYAVGYNKVSFSDVSTTAWYNDAVTFLAARGITSGTTETNFSPDVTLTRGQFITLLLRAYEISPDTGSTDNFTDAGSTYYTSYLAAAKQLGITSGIGDNMFAPDEAITRQDMFTLLYSALKVTGNLPQVNTGKTLSDFTDAGSVASWATDAMTALVRVGTVTGDSGKLNPTGTTTRAEMAQVLYNLLGK
ncbi:MAG: S-layer homology domain-containing protein [Oscillospiraceae bacterium]|nr:S-layer homology domain-containing protein [Oscillospiraceae bacterium]